MIAEFKERPCERPFWDGVEGRIVHREADLAFVTASLYDSTGQLIATATATAHVIPLAAAATAV